MKKHTANQLQYETSPYLLQHAGNPVNWYPWGEKALNLAHTENKPILVSIGYAACHWCHVMEKESFENEAIAAFMNEHFINIKIDREERPDLDHIYMDAVQAMTGSGGWPLNVFLTPDKQPFYGGTYFPPVKVHNRPGWLEVLEGVSRAFNERNKAILEQAKQLTDHLLKSNSFGINTVSTVSEAEIFSSDTCNTIAKNILQQADIEDGGFGAAPKFPQSFCIRYLLRHYHFSKDEAALNHALLSLDKMILGGIYDQIGGGFARYSTDKKWVVPHFEKMLYDNALMIMVLAEAFQLTRKEAYQSAIHQTIGFIRREMMNDESGFFSALDADSEGEEGKYYVWTQKEIEAILGADAGVFCEYYQVREQGNWEEGKKEPIPTNILWAKNYPLTDQAALLENCKARLMEKRSTRVRPQLDDKVLLGWNALMVVALCKAFAALGDETYRQMAVRNIHFLEKRFSTETGFWHHTYKNEKATITAFLDDYAYLIQAYIHLQEITGEADYLLKAKELTILVMSHFGESATGFFYYTPDFQTDVLLRKKEIYDGATPSGNAVMVNNLRYLSVVFDIPEWNERANGLITAVQHAVLKHPSSFAVWALAVQEATEGIQEIVITGQEAGRYLFDVNNRYWPNKILQTAPAGMDQFPLLKGKSFKKDEVLFYLCKNYSCRPAFNNLDAFLANV